MTDPGDIMEASHDHGTCYECNLPVGADIHCPAANGDRYLVGQPMLCDLCDNEVRIRTNGRGAAAYRMVHVGCTECHAAIETLIGDMGVWLCRAHRPRVGPTGYITL